MKTCVFVIFLPEFRAKKWGGRSAVALRAMADKPDSNPASFHYAVTSRRPPWATRKGGARSEPERRRYAGAGQPIYSRRRAIGWFSSQSVRSTRFRRISFFEPESYTFRAKKNPAKRYRPPESWQKNGVVERTRTVDLLGHNQAL